MPKEFLAPIVPPDAQKQSSVDPVKPEKKEKAVKASTKTPKSKA
jgi:hypothetical protein